MSSTNVIGFFQFLAKNSEIKNSLSSKSKSEVLEYANRNGFTFSIKEFDDTIWGYEQSLAANMKENFDLSFSLWETMWGRNYLEYLVDNLIATYDYGK